MRSRPKNLNLMTIHFPITAIVSLLHRISGFILFLLIPFAIALLSYSLSSQGFLALQKWFSHPIVKLVLWFFLIPFCYHLVAGIRHLLSDINIGDSKWGGRTGAVIALFVTAILILLTGIWLW